LQRGSKEQITNNTKADENHDEHNQKMVQVGPRGGDGAGQHVEAVLKLKVLEYFQGREEDVEGVDNELVEGQFGSVLDGVIERVGRHNGRAIDHEEEQLHSEVNRGDEEDIVHPIERVPEAAQIPAQDVTIIHWWKGSDVHPKRLVLVTAPGRVAPVRSCVNTPRNEKERGGGGGG
jgi:hypothetical protein